MDLIVGLSDGTLAYYKNVGSATNPAFVVTSGSSNPVDDLDVSTANDDYYYDAYGDDEGTAPTLIDFDGDGALDLIVGHDDGKLHYFRNEGSATAPLFSPVELFLRDAAGDITVALFSFPAVGDIDGDGDLDLVVGAKNGKLFLFANSFCTTTCNKRGVCDGFLPVCNCLTGFTGEHCDECPAGYFGSDCQLCPEGGEENRGAPRITDTCGVKGSGRSRGACDQGFTGSGNCSCFEEHFAGAGCSEGGCPAGTVESVKQNENGLFYDAFCEPCKPGEYQGFIGEQAFCMRCPAPSTSVVAGATECPTCSAGSYFSPFPVGSARCDNLTALAAQCRDEDDPACFDQCCLKCEKGMICETPANNTLQALAIEDGWWRDTLYSHQVYPCKYTDSCKAGACTTGHEGVACRVCEAGYHYSSMDGRCI